MFQATDISVTVFSARAGACPPNLFPGRQVLFDKRGEQGTPVAETCRYAGISRATCYSWKIEASLRHWSERDAEGMAGCCRTRCGG